MVGKQKTSNAALGAGSRTNSTQAGPKAAKSKPAQPDSLSSKATNGTPASNESAKSSSWFASSAKSKKGRKQKSQQPKPRSFIDKAVLFLLSVFVLYTVSTCPFDKALQDPVCNSLALYRAHIIEPYLLPPVYQALQHPTVQPYLEKASDISHQVIPYIISADQLTRPYLRYAKVLTWDKTLVPTFNNVVVPQYYAHVYPQLQQLYAHVDPYIGPTYTTVSTTAKQAYSYGQTAYDLTFPHAHQAYTFVKPYALDAYVQAKPYANQGYEFARVKSAEGYELAKPHAIVAYGVALEYLKIALVELAKLRRQYVDKHVGDIWDKVVELSGSKSEGSLSSSATTLASSASETLATTLSSASETAAESASSLSSTVAEVTASVVDEVKSATRVVEEVVATPSPEAEEPVVQTPSASSTSVTVEPSTVSSADEATSDSGVDVDLQEFLANLGISEQQEESATADTVASPSATDEEEEEEKAVPELATTAERRADIKARHEQWSTQLNELFEVEATRVRSTLNGVRSSSARAVFDQGSESSIIDPSLELDEEEKKTIMLADGVRMSKVLDILSAEGTLLLNGLDAVLKKEEAAKDAKSTEEELQKKEAKWMEVLQKVENKFYGSVSGIQEKVHGWFTAVKDLEIRKCLESSNRVKALAEEAQADLGRDYTWLEDVTVNDWKSYHELLDVYSEFDVAVRELQNNTHVDPVEDSVISALDKLQTELTDVIGGFSIRARTLHQKAVHEIFAVPTEETETEDDSPVKILPNFWGADSDASEAEEPEVSILPIDPPKAVGTEGEVDASKIVVGKDASQIEKMLKDVPVESPRHEEL